MILILIYGKISILLRGPGYIVFKKEDFNLKKYNVLVFLKMLVIRRIMRVESYNYKEIIKLIIEYNERKQNK